MLSSENCRKRPTRAAWASLLHAGEGPPVASPEGGVLRSRLFASTRRKCLLLGAGAVLAISAFTAPALADSGAHKVNFLDLPTVATCDGPIGGTPDASFAVIEATGNGRVTADVSLKNGQPNALYSVELVQSGCSSFSVTTATTNGQGNANAPLTARQVSSDASVFVDEISPVPNGDFQQTPEVTFGP
jgi:hypothetical protein